MKRYEPVNVVALCHGTSDTSILFPRDGSLLFVRTRSDRPNVL